MSPNEWPRDLPGSNPASPWGNKLSRCAQASHIRDVKFIGGQAKMLQDKQGTTLVLTPPSQLLHSVFFPFKIYNINNYVDPTLSALTVQIRSGIIAARTAFNINYPTVENNYEQPIFCGLDGDDSQYLDRQPTALIGGNITLDNAADTLIFDSGSPISTTPNDKQIVIDGTDDALGFENSSYWVEILDDPTDGLSYKLWGRMWCQSAGSFPPTRQITPFPNPSPNIIQLGIIIARGGTITVIQQYLFDNLINRYSPGPSGSVPSVGIMRGRWMDNSLSGRVFWPGDRMIGSTILLTLDGTDLYGTWTYTGIPANVSTEPLATDANWLLEGIAPQ